MAVMAGKAEKITVTIPYELKEQLTALKNEFGTTMSALYKDALKSYVEQKERERWRKAAELMAEEYEKSPELTDWLDFEEDFYDYKAV
ncbi:MAG: type II toxin-antitoxin system CcdA family antitoxin [Campylobacterota bacterium]|nr:type II toxin-antitoxin system CcdA family antitoxin [Campylobacterota bacterium]